MKTPKIKALGINQQWSTTRWKGRGYVDGVGWLEAWGTSLIGAMEAVQALAVQRVAEHEQEESCTTDIKPAPRGWPMPAGAAVGASHHASTTAVSPLWSVSGASNRGSSSRLGGTRMHQEYSCRGESRLMGTPIIPPGRISRARNRSRGHGDRWARGRLGAIMLVALLLVPAVVRAQAMRWPEAVAARAAERTRAETCGRLLKRHAGDEAAVRSLGELAYAEADVDAVIAGLTIVLAQGGTPPDLADLEARLTRRVEAREAFCREVIARVPDDPGTRNPLVALLGAVLPPLLEAARALYTFTTEQDRLLRQTIQTQLEATTWSPFADLTP